MTQKQDIVSEPVEWNSLDDSTQTRCLQATQAGRSDREASELIWFFTPNYTLEDFCKLEVIKWWRVGTSTSNDTIDRSDTATESWIAFHDACYTSHSAPRLILAVQATDGIVWMDASRQRQD